MGLYTPGRKNPLSSSGSKAPVLAQSDLSRILPRQNSTGSTRGTQNIGVGNMKLDGANNRITIGAPDGSTVGLGAIPGTTPVEYGLFTLDSSGNVVTKIIDGSIYIMDGDLVRMLAGFQPDGTVDVNISKNGESVLDAFSA